jgi:TatD DNase family protein
MPLIDTHCHLNVAEFFPEPDPFVARAQEAGVADLVLIGLDVVTSQAAIDLAERHKGVWATVGRHPNYSTGYDKDELKQIRRLLQHPKVVALGEVGLDEHWDDAPAEQQEACLRDQLELAYELDKPVVLHCRKAYQRLLAILEERPDHPYVFHCFSGSAEDAVRANAMGCYFGIDGPITYKKNGEFRELVATLPQDRLLIETDSPFLPPEPYRGKPNEPSLLPWVNRGLAAALGLTEEDCAAQTTANAKAFFRLPG